MPITRPYFRTVRQLVDGSYANSGNGQYVNHPSYAESPGHYVRALKLLQRDLEELFYAIEPADQNLQTYSYRIHELLMRTCIEVEANFKAILDANLYGAPRHGRSFNIVDYRNIERSHRLSDYVVRAPLWNGHSDWKPFVAWKNPIGQQSLPWYDAYNTTKHNRATEFSSATFEHLISAFAALVVILSAQFRDHDFAPGITLVGMAWHGMAGPGDGWDEGAGGYFRVKYPHFAESDRYEVDGRALLAEAAPFDAFPY